MTNKLVKRAAAVIGATAMSIMVVSANETKYEENGWHTISMKEDFLTIYGDQVVERTQNQGMN